MRTFVDFFLWTVAVLSGLVTILALFGGQRWLEQKGWALNSGATIEATDSDAVSPEPAGDSGSVADSSGTDWDGIWASTTSWSAETFDNVLWGIVAIGVSMLLAAAAGALIEIASVPYSNVAAFFQVVLAVVCAAAVAVMGILLHAADPGYLGWFIALTVISVPVGYRAQTLD